MVEARGHYCIRVRVGDGDAAERVWAEAWAAGAGGAEERAAPQGVTLLLYVPAGSEGAVERAVRSAVSNRECVSPAERVEEVDWSTAWRHGLEAIEISERLVVRPSFVPFERAPGQRELVVDPGRAFGTGGHASTSLALQWIDALHPVLRERTRVLDVGTGTGVLALAALRLGAGRAVALDLDPVAVREARLCAGANGLTERLELLVGPVAAIRGAVFDLVIANLLRRELLPLVDDLAARTREGGRLVVSGLLDCEASAVEAAFRERGFGPARIRSSDDPAGDRWAALLMKNEGCPR